jgi:hypothetical protein
VLNRVFANMCSTFSVPPSVLFEEDCPRVFTIWREVIKQKSNELRDMRRWDLITAPLHRSMMGEEGGQEQNRMLEELMERLEDPAVTKERIEDKNREAEAKLKALGINVVKRG